MRTLGVMRTKKVRTLAVVYCIYFLFRNKAFFNLENWYCQVLVVKFKYCCSINKSGIFKHTGLINTGLPTNMES